MSDLLFDVPWWLPTLVGLIGVVLLFNANRSQVAKVRNAGIGLIAVAILWGLLSYLVETDKEKVEKGTRQFVQSAIDGSTTGNWTPFQTFLTPNTTMTAGGVPLAVGGQEIAAYGKANVEMVHLKSAHVSNLTIKETAPTITADFDLQTTQDAIAPMETSSWEFTWEKVEKTWKLKEIRLVELHGVPTENLRQFVPRGK